MSLSFRFDITAYLKRGFFALCVVLMALVPHVAQAQSNNVATVTYDNITYQLPLPAGYCDVSKDPLGVTLLNFVRQAVERMGIGPDPQIAYLKCGFVPDEKGAYPWGYIGFERPTIPQMREQAGYNQMVASLFGQESVIKELMQSAGEANRETLGEFGIDSEGGSIGTPQLVWQDDNVIAFRVLNQVQLPGQLVKEFTTGASSTLGDHLIHYYITDLVGGATVPSENAELLIQNAAELKKINQ